MHPAYFSATVIALSLILSATIVYLTQWLSKILKSQQEILTTTQNLLVSKDLTTFQNLQWTTTESFANSQSKKSQSEPVEEVPILDDEALAIHMAKRYEAQGMDPNLALNNDDVDFRSEFGI